MDYRVIVELTEAEYTTLEQAFSDPESDDGWTLSAVEQAVTRRAFQQATLARSRHNGDSKERS